MSKEMRVRIVFTDEALGTNPGDPEVHDKYVASKAPDAKTRAEEIAEHGVEEEIEKSKTIFLKDPKTGEPILSAHQINGFFKEIQKTLNDMSKQEKEYKSLYMANYKKVIDTEVIPLPKNIKFHLPDEGEVGDCQRPLRAETAQGPRVALANSETIPNGTWIEFTLLCTAAPRMDAMIHCLNYGRIHGIGQWRNAGKGTFYWEELDADGNVIGGDKQEWEEMKARHNMD